jgi:hypothetical protein
MTILPDVVADGLIACVPFTVVALGITPILLTWSSIATTCEVERCPTGALDWPALG